MTRRKSWKTITTSDGLVIHFREIRRVTMKSTIRSPSVEEDENNGDSS